MLDSTQSHFMYHPQLEAEHRVQILEERVKIAEEHTHSLTRKKLETEEEIRRVRASAIKVGVYPTGTGVREI